MNRLAVVAALAALLGCGNYSTEDLRFLVALPAGVDLRVAVPAPAAAGGALVVCDRPAEVWLQGKPKSDQFNAAVDWVLGLVDAVRRLSPTHRGDDWREWGPFDDARHPGIEVHVVIARAWPAGPDAPPVHAYAFEARPRGTEPWLRIIDGTFVGASASTGTGAIALYFDDVTQLGMGDASTPTGTVSIDYDRASEPRTIDLRLRQSTQAGFGLERFDYAWAGYQDGNGRFAYAFRQGFNVWTVDAGFDGVGRGRALVAFDGVFTGTSVEQCWDENACLVWSSDVGGCGTPPCPYGDRSLCPTVTASPF